MQEGLAGLIATRHRDEIAKHNASLSIRLVEEALSNMAERIMAVQRGVMDDEISKADLQTILLEDFREEES